MFTNTFTIERHIEELRAELGVTADPEEARDIWTELEVTLQAAADLQRESVTVLTGMSESGECRSRLIR